MAMLDEEIAKSDAAKKAKAEEEKRIEVEGIAKEWAIKEYTLRMLGGDLDSSVSEKDFMISAWDEALREAEKTYELIHSEGYIKEREMLDKAKAGSENKLFWDGMPPKEGEDGREREEAVYGFVVRGGIGEDYFERVGEILGEMSTCVRGK